MNRCTARLVLGLMLALPGAAQEPAHDPWPRADAAVQAELGRVLAAQTAEAQRAALEELRALGNQRLVPQLMLFLAAATSTRESMLFGVVRRELALSADELASALVPLLESPDPDHGRAVAGVLAEIERKGVERPADFSAYRSFLEREPPPGLLRHLFATDPDAALLACLRAQVHESLEQRSLLWAWHELADLRWKLAFGFVESAALPAAAGGALDSIDVLARSPRPWARLAAAHIALEWPALREAAHLDELLRDSDPLVREVARAASEVR